MHVWRMKIALADVLIDAGCPLQDESVVQSFLPRLVNVLAPGFRPERGSVLLIGTRVVDGRNSESAVRDIRHRFPSAAIYVCGVGDPTVPNPIVRYARAGADEVFDVRTPSDLAHLVRMVKARTLAPLPAQELELVAEMLPSGPERRIALYSLRNAFHPRSVSRVSRAFGYAARTTAERFRKADLSTPQDVLRVGRLLHLVELHRQGIASSALVASRLGFADADSLRQWVWKLRRSKRQNPRLRRFMDRIPVLQLAAPDENAFDP